MRYPKRIIPRLHYKEMGILPGVHFGKFFLIRTAPDNRPVKSHKELLGRLGELMKASQFRNGGLSVTLLSRYKKKDCRYIVNYEANPEYSKYWKKGEQAVRPLSRDVTYKRNRGYFGVGICDVLAVSKPMNLKKDGVSIGNHLITLVVEHKPTKSNFWHCEMVLYGEHITDDPEKKYVKRLLDITSKTVVENVGGEMLAQLKSVMRLPNEMKEYSLCSRFYKLLRC